MFIAKRMFCNGEQYSSSSTLMDYALWSVTIKNRLILKFEPYRQLVGLLARVISPS
jgi:hypothetical protein